MRDANMLAGAIVYAFCFAWLNENVISVWKLGRVTLSEVSGLPPIVRLFALAIVAMVLFVAVERGARGR